MFKKYKYKIFDFDGTIVHLQVDWQALRDDVFKTFYRSCDFKPDKLSTMIEYILTDGMQNRPHLTRLIEKYEQQDNAVKFTPICGIVDILRRIDCFYIVSNNLHSTIAHVMGKLGLSGKCGKIVGFDDVSEIKPSPAPFNNILETTNDTQKSRYLYVGDRLTDKMFAANSGIDFMSVKEII